MSAERRPLDIAKIREALKSMDGLSQLQAYMLNKENIIRSMTETLNFHLVEAETGRAVFEGNPGHEHINLHGIVHGGWAGAIMDTAMACAVHSTLKVGETYSTVEYKLNFVRPILPAAGTVRCTGTLLSRGRRIATSEGRLEDASGKLLAHGTETCVILPIEPEQ
ncbi:MAG: PaaI family thioesterase [Rhodobiaceae bacterium]|nr:PaaI family thioesterase [Rhodobiaceae bacterium]MCC0054792.1 PaaI family thioesterase [Rhodobiaceae bacterium]